MDLTALFLNYVPRGQTVDSVSVLPVDEPLDGVVQTGPVQRQNRLEETKILEMVASYVAGMSIAALARQFEINETTVRAHLSRQQVERRPYRKVTPAQLQEAISLYEGGMSVRGVARYLGVAQDTATRMLIDAGVRRAR